jgi:transcriptional antiterminator RfaH
MSIPVVDKNWYVLQYKPNSHMIAKKNLSRQGFETFMPCEKKSKNQYNRSIEYTRPLFPGYMFINFDLNQAPWMAINSTPGVTRLVFQNKTPRNIPDKFVLELINRCDENGLLLQKNNLKAGDKIKLVNSPFTELFATIEKIDSERRIWILMDILGRSSRISLSENHVR